MRSSHTSGQVANLVREDSRPIFRVDLRWDSYDSMAGESVLTALRFHTYVETSACSLSLSVSLSHDAFVHCTTPVLQSGSLTIFFCLSVFVHSHSCVQVLPQLSCIYPSGFPEWVGFIKTVLSSNALVMKISQGFFFCETLSSITSMFIGTLLAPNLIWCVGAHTCLYLTLHTFCDGSVCHWPVRKQARYVDIVFCCMLYIYFVWFDRLLSHRWDCTPYLARIFTPRDFPRHNNDLFNS